MVFIRDCFEKNIRLYFSDWPISDYILPLFIFNFCKRCHKGKNTLLLSTILQPRYSMLKYDCNASLNTPNFIWELQIAISCKLN